jgi:hypothetical protein
MRGGYTNNYSSTNWHYFSRIDSRRTHLSRIVRMEASLVATGYDGSKETPSGLSATCAWRTDIPHALRATLFGTSHLCAMTHITECLL